jgi:hypothetical protein
MDKRGQGSKVLVFALIAIFAVFILYFGFNYVSQLAESTRQNQLITFTKSMQSMIETQAKRGFGSRIDKVIAAPEGVTSICFTDNKKGFDEFASNELTSQIESYPESNFFIMPLENFNAETLDGFEVDKNPLCIEAVNGRISLKLTTKQGVVKVEALSKEAEIDECTSIFYTSEPNDGIDIVFLGQAYDDVEDFKSEAYSYINDVFFDLEPFRSNRDKFNFYMVDDMVDLGCTFQGYVICNNFKVKKVASRCPHEFIFILIDRNKFKDFINPIRSSAVSNIANINTADEPRVLMHEFGHSFADLADEYVDAYYSSIKFNGLEYANCDNNRCAKWSGTEGTRCIQGCSTSGYYRGTEDSLMRSLSADYFGPINEEAIIEKLSVYR